MQIEMEKLFFSLNCTIAASATTSIVGRMKMFSSICKQAQNEQLSTVINYFQIMSNGSFLFGAAAVLMLQRKRERDDYESKNNKIHTPFVQNLNKYTNEMSTMS